MNARPETIRRRSQARLAAKASAAPLLAVALAIALPVAHSEEKKAEKNFGDLSLEELMNESVTSVSKREQKLTDAAAAIAVLTNDDLRRSGATTLADALRLVPGMNVGTVNSHEAAVSARGFNFVFSNKLLVLVDGRAVYTPLFSGVYWDLQQTMLEDVDRIEAIRGPGATIWGANAVNGVINVVTHSARDTPGGLLYAGGGDLHRAMSGVRYGGQLGERTYYRVFASYQSNDDTPLASGQSSQDHWQGRHGGFRLDHYSSQDTHITWQSDATHVESQGADGYNVNTLGRWTRQLAPRSSVEVQAYYDRTFRDEDNRSRPLTDIFDVTLQHALEFGARHDVIYGGGYRFIANVVEPTSPLTMVRRGKFNRQIFSAFVQDDLKLVPDRLTLTAGLKLEHHDLIGLEFQPSVRAVFKPAEQQTVWAAVSRAVRTPNEVENHDLFAIVVGPPFSGPGGGLYLPALVGNPTVKSDVLWAFELGYRVQPSKRVSVDLAGFFNRYDRVISYGPFGNFVPGVPFGTAEIPWQNLLASDAYGGEASVTATPADQWRLTAGYAFIRQQFSGPALGSRDVARPPPRNQLTLRSSHDFGRQLSLNVQLRYVDAIPAAPAYLTADLRLAYRPNDRLEFSLVGQNLFDPQHPEQDVVPITTTTEVPRSFYGKITLRF